MNMGAVIAHYSWRKKLMIILCVNLLLWLMGYAFLFGPICSRLIIENQKTIGLNADILALQTKAIQFGLQQQRVGLLQKNHILMKNMIDQFVSKARDNQLSVSGVFMLPKTKQDGAVGDAMKISFIGKYFNFVKWVNELSVYPHLMLLDFNLELDKNSNYLLGEVFWMALS